MGILAETLLETALDAVSDPDDPATLPRAGAWASEAVSAPTTIALLRLRHRIDTLRREGREHLLAEEATAIAWAGSPLRRVAEGDVALALLDALARPVADIVRDRQLAAFRQQLDHLRSDLDTYAAARAAALAEDHARIRKAAETEAARLRGTVTVTPLLPTDIVGLYVLLPVI